MVGLTKKGAVPPAPPPPPLWVLCVFGGWAFAFWRLQYVEERQGPQRAKGTTRTNARCGSREDKMAAQQLQKAERSTRINREAVVLGSAAQ